MGNIERGWDYEGRVVELFAQKVEAAADTVKEGPVDA